MARSNSLEAKAGRRIAKDERKHRASKGLTRTGKVIKHLGIYVTQKMVKAQRYLANNDLPFSMTVASVFIKEDAVTNHGPQLVL